MPPHPLGRVVIDRQRRIPVRAGEPGPARMLHQHVHPSVSYRPATPGGRSHRPRRSRRGCPPADPRAQIDVGVGAFVDSVGATQIIVGLQRLSAMPIDIAVTEVQQAIDSRGPG